jgi:threonine dehydrogenase-like Zn-dependent dehydrogenase
MKAAIVEKPGHLRIHDIERPVAGDYKARCEILYGAICSGTDTHIVDGAFPFTGPYPTILGHESIGRVVEVGAKVRNLRIGDIVTRVGCPAQGQYSSTWGGFAEFGLAWDWRAMQSDGLPVDNSQTVNEIVPADCDPATATMFITWRETFSYLTRLGVRTGQRILILGSGGNGLAFAAHARNLGAFSVVVGAANRAAVARAAGAGQFFNYRGSQLSEQLREAFPDGFDVAIDAVGRAGGLDFALSLLKPGGTVGLYGMDDWGQNLVNPMQARGSFTFYNGGYDEQESHEAITNFVRAKKLDAALWIDLENPTPFECINDAFQQVRNRGSLKAVVRIRG